MTNKGEDRWWRWWWGCVAAPSLCRSCSCVPEQSLLSSGELLSRVVSRSLLTREMVPRGKEPVGVRRVSRTWGAGKQKGCLYILIPLAPLHS